MRLPLPLIIFTLTLISLATSFKFEEEADQGVKVVAKSNSTAGNSTETKLDKTQVHLVDEIETEALTAESEQEKKDASNREARKIASASEDQKVEGAEEEEHKEGDEQDPEGRFFLKNKLCFLGLGDCPTENIQTSAAYSHPRQGYGSPPSGPSNTYSSGSSGSHGYTPGSIQYVQPVKVVPNGPPVPAVPVSGSHHHHTTSYDSSSSTGYGAPKAPSYNPSSTTYTTTYESASSYGAPISKPSYSPKPSYDSPVSSYGAPIGGSSSYSPPSSSYGSPSYSYNGKLDAAYSQETEYIATSGNDRYQTSFNQGFKRDIGGPGSLNGPQRDPNTFVGTDDHDHQHAHGGHGGNLDLTAGTATSFSGGQQQFNNQGQFAQGQVGQGPTGQSPSGTGHRQARRDECYCVPAAQCPVDSIMNKNGANFQDYSKLIDPRIKATAADIVAAEEEDSLDLDEASIENNRARSLAYSNSTEIKNSTKSAEEEDSEKVDLTKAGTGNDGVVLPKKSKSINGTVEARRRRRDLTEEHQDEDVEFFAEGKEVGDHPTNYTDAHGRKLTNAYVPITDKHNDAEGLIDALKTSKDEFAEEEEEKEESDKKTEKDLEGRKKGECGEQDCTDDKKTDDDKSRLDLSSVTSAVSDKVAAVGNTVSAAGSTVSNGVKTGVDRIAGTLGDIFGFKLPNGTLEPTVGVSFGLPQYGPGYGGFPQNPLGTGSAINPYFSSPNGLPVGAVDVNPLVSFQTTTDERGGLIAKPLINLHVTPNGCGILGCDVEDPFGNRKTGSGGPGAGLLDFLFPKKNGQNNNNNNNQYYEHGQQQEQYGPPNRFDQDGFEPSYNQQQQGYNQQQQYGYQQQQPSYQQQQPVFKQQQPAYQDSQYNQPQQPSNYPQSPQPDYQTPVRSNFQQNPTKSVSFNSDPTVVKHEHHHFYHDDKHSEGIRFGYRENGNVYGRNKEDSVDGEHEDDFEESNNVKRDSVTATNKIKEDFKPTAVGSVENVPIKEVRPGQGEKKVLFPAARSVSRKKRSADGAGHHGHHDHHHDDQFSAPNQQLAGSSSVSTDLRQFGPTGASPPTCGGPASGFVCCKVGTDQYGQTIYLSADDDQRDNRKNPLDGQPSNINQVAFNTGKPQTGFNNNNFNNNNKFTAQPSNVGSVNQPGFISNNNNNNKNFNSFNNGLGQCGQRNAHGINGRIAGNKFAPNEGDTEFGEYPWQVAILKKEEFDNVYLCGGALIDGSHLLTAAHCIRDYRPEQLRIRLGEWDVNNDSEFYPHVEFDAKNVFVHQQFYPGNLYNDIAMVRIDGFVDYAKNPHISPVCLPDPQQTFNGRRCFVTGWGKDAFLEGSYQHVLKEVELPVISSPYCEQLLQNTKLGREFALHEGFMCAGGEEGKDACKGDGGGPLVCEVSGVWQLAGIVSWGVGCGQYNVPGVYVKVSQYQEWIQEQVLRRN